MADGTEQSGQSSSQSTGQSQSGTGQQQGSGSQTTQTQTQQSGAQQATRPSYVPESHWDSSAAKVKDTFAAHINELTSFRAAAESKDLAFKAALPTPDAYKNDLPSDFKAPDGVQFQFRADDPLLSQARTLAHQMGMSQENFSKLLGLYAGAQVATQQQVTAARNAEIAKLGATGPARIDALTTFFKAQLGEAEGAQLMSRVFTAKDVEIAEKVVAKISGSGAFNAGGREPPEAPGKLSDEQLAKLSPAEKLDYTRQRSAQKQMPDWKDPRGLAA